MFGNLVHYVYCSRQMPYFFAHLHALYDAEKLLFMIADDNIRKPALLIGYCRKQTWYSNGSTILIRSFMVLTGCLNCISSGFTAEKLFFVLQCCYRSSTGSLLTYILKHRFSLVLCISPSILSRKTWLHLCVLLLLKLVPLQNFRYVFTSISGHSRLFELWKKTTVPGLDQSQSS